MQNKTGAVLLSAGFSNRFGGLKLLAKLKSGVTVFAQTYSQLHPAVSDILVVTRPDLEDQLRQFSQELLIFGSAENGMGSTLAFAMQNVPAWDSVLVCLGDMPFIKTSTYQQIAAASDSESIVVPLYKGQKGNPVSFGSRFFSDLQNLSGDFGAREVLKRYPQAIKTIELSDDAVLDDIDTPADLKRLQSE